MVNVKNTLTGLCLLAATVSAASIHNEKRHVHHRRNKKPCSASASVPIQSVNKVVSTSSVPAVVTVSVVPVPVNPAPSAPASSVAASAVVGSSHSVASAPAASGCGVATAYVTVQETITVTAGALPSTSSTSTSSLSSSSTSSSTSTSSSSTSVVAAVSKAKAPSPPVSAIIETPVPISVAPTTTTASASAGGFLQGSVSSSAAVVATSAAAAPVGGGYTGAKMGMSWIPGGPWSALDITMPWVYDWGQVANGVPSGTEYIPTLHDGDKCAGFAAQLESQSGIHFVKHFNEPDEQGYGGSGLSVDEAAALHTKYISGLAGKYALGLPAVTSNNNGMSGTNWLTAFVKKVGCDDFSFADFHFYGGSEATEQQAKIFLGYVDNWVSVVDAICPNKNLPIWITEFSAGPNTGDVGQAATFMSVAGPALEANARVARYSYFFPSNNVLSSAATAIEKALRT